jgi:hypothetical protein
MPRISVNLGKGIAIGLRQWVLVSLSALPENIVSH